MATRPGPALTASVMAASNTAKRSPNYSHTPSRFYRSPCISKSAPQHTPGLIGEQGGFPEFNNRKDPKGLEMTPQVFGLPLSIHLPSVSPAHTFLQPVGPSPMSLVSYLLEKLSRKKEAVWQQGTWGRWGWEAEQGIGAGFCFEKKVREQEWLQGCHTTLSLCYCTLLLHLQ